MRFFVACLDVPFLDNVQEELVKRRMIGPALVEFACREVQVDAA